MKFAFVDVETTGGSPGSDRIIDIGIILMDNNTVTGRYETLFNPQCTLSPFITSLTGITEYDLLDAPLFADKIDEITDLLQDRIFVAHNVRFDYSFLKHEFLRLNRDLTLPQLCTVKLSRRLAPELSSHNLDSLINHYQINIGKRHRALPDAEAIASFYNIMNSLHGNEYLEPIIHEITRHPSLPPKVPADEIASLPNSPGVYIFYTNDGSPLYVGKSIHIKERVLSHFYDDIASSKELRIKEQTSHIESQICAGEFEALLTESRLIKSMMPIYNKKLRNNSGIWTAQLSLAGDYSAIELKSCKHIDYSDYQSILAAQKSKRQLNNLVSSLCSQFELCPKLCGLEKGQGACFSYHLGTCHGACVNEEDISAYNMRVRQAFSATSIQTWPFHEPIVVHEFNETADLHAYHLIDNWTVLATGRTIEEVLDVQDSHSCALDLDEYMIVKRYLLSHTHSAHIVPVSKVQVY